MKLLVAHDYAVKLVNRHEHIVITVVEKPKTEGAGDKCSVCTALLLQINKNAIRTTYNTLQIIGKKIVQPANKECLFIFW